MPRSRFTLQALLSGRAHDYAHLARPLLHSLERTHHFEIEVARELESVTLVLAPLTELALQARFPGSCQTMSVTVRPR